MNYMRDYDKEPESLDEISKVGYGGVLCIETGKYGINIPKGVWHKLESLEAGSVIFECKEGPFVPHELDGILEVNY